MKKTVFSFAEVFLLMGVLLVLSSSTCSETSNVRDINRVKPIVRQKTVTCDSLVVARLGDSVASVLFNANKAIVYKINPLASPKDDEKTIGGLKVVEKISEMNSEQILGLKFLLSDSLCYTDKPMVPATPFSPGLAVELYNGKTKIALLFSFVSQEFGVVMNGEVIKTHRYTNSRLLTRLFVDYMDRERFNYLMNIIK